MSSQLLQTTIDNVMQQTDKKACEKLNNESHEIKGYDLNNGLDYNKILESYLNTGFQATNFGKAVNEINRMVSEFRQQISNSWLI
jgi:deoxyhypusine synthase